MCSIPRGLLTPTACSVLLLQKSRAVLCGHSTESSKDLHGSASVGIKLTGGGPKPLRILHEHVPEQCSEQQQTQSMFAP